MEIHLQAPATFRASARAVLTATSCNLVLALLCMPVSAQPGAWTRQRVSSLAWLHSVFFLDENRGWAVGSRGTLLATSDGGKSWQAKAPPTLDVLRDILFVDYQNGWLVCEVNTYELKGKEDQRTYLMRTTDGGETWKRINIRGAEVDARLLRAVFSQGGRGWVFGEEGVILTTRDSGESWTRLQSPTRRLLLGGIFIDEYRGWLVGAGSTVIQTSDGGETWHSSRLTDAIRKPIRFAATSFVDNRLGWVVGSAGSIYRTTNGGRTWQQQHSGVVTDLFDVKFVDAVEGWAVGAEGTIIYTNDGGQHWSLEQSGTEHPLERVFFASPRHGWAVGFGGTVLRYVRAEASGLSK